MYNNLVRCNRSFRPVFTFVRNITPGVTPVIVYCVVHLFYPKKFLLDNRIVAILLTCK